MIKMAKLEEKAKQLRIEVLEMTTRAGIGHVTSSFSCMELMVALYYTGAMKYHSDDPKWPGRDYFILSKGHANPIMYCILADVGYFPKEKLKKFCLPGGDIGVLLRGDIPGTEITSGSLGCGLGIAAGIAEAMKMDGRDNLVYCMVGDAEIREGAIWEAAAHIGFRKLNNIVMILDRNHLGAVHFVDQEAGIDPIDDRLEAFGFRVRSINGHDMGQVVNAMNREELQRSDKPTAIIADTVKGKGVSFIENQPFLHGLAVKQEDLDRAIAEINRGLTV